MPNLERGKVYRIVCRKTGLKYVGSTTAQYLSQRLPEHVHNHKKSRNGCTSRQVIDNGDYYIELLEECPCNERKELSARERYWVEKEPCVNKCIPGRTHAECMREWVNNNREKWNTYMRDYRRKRREALKQEALATK